MLLIAIFSLGHAMPPADSWVPGATLMTTHDRHELHFKTPAGTLVEIELDRSGNPEEASGNALLTGDVLTPGGERLDLASIGAVATKLGLTPSGEWSLELERGSWVYEIEGTIGNQRWSVDFDARTGSELHRERD